MLIGCALLLTFVLFTGCEKRKPENQDDEVRPDVDGLEPVDDWSPDADVPDIDVLDDADADMPDEVDEDLPDGADEIPDEDVSDVDEDTDSDADSDADSDDGCEPSKGFNPCAAKFSGPIGDLDARTGGVVAFGGSPASVYVCDTSGMGEAACQVKATIPAGLFASQRLFTPFGYSLATAVPQGEKKPISIFKIDEGASNPADAILGRKDIAQITISSGSDPLMFDLAGPGGIAAFSSAQVPVERFFVGAGQATNDGSTVGMLLALADFDGDWASLRMPGLAKGLETSGVASTTLNLGEGDKEYVVAMNAGRIDASDPFEAGISIFDPDASSVLRVKHIPLGEAELSRVAEISFDSTGRKAWVSFEKPAAAIKLVNLESGSVEKEVLLGSAVAGEVADMVLAGSRLYLADSGGGVVFVDLSADAVMGSVALPDAPTACAMSEGLLFCAVGERLAAIDPEEVELD